MKFIILKDKLKEGVNAVERISGKSLNLPILNNILIGVEKNFLNLTTTDLEIGINWWSLVKKEKEGKLAVPAKILSNLINFLPNKPIELESENLNLRIKCDNYRTQIKGFNPEDFPLIPKISESNIVPVNNQLFCKSLSQIVDIPTYSSTKPEISGIYFLFQKDLIVMTATDSFRLGEKKLFLDPPLNSLSEQYCLILPQKAAKEIINVFGEKEGELKIYLSANQVLFETPLPETPHPKIQLISRLIEGEYPNYQEIIPKKHDARVSFSKNEFTNQIKLASFFSGKINEVKLKINPKQNKIDISSQSPDLGDYHSFMNGRVEGRATEVSFNYRFLIDGLLNIKTPEVVLELVGSDGPGVLKPKNDNSSIYLIMPIKAD